MIKRILFAALAALIIYSCSHRSHPAKSNAPAIDSVAIKKTADSLQAVKALAKRKAKPPTPKMIEVNDDAAHKSVDGRLYYDVMGHRYWKNYKNGKYYLFNKSMFNNSDFAPPSASSQ